MKLFGHNQTTSSREINRIGRKLFKTKWLGALAADEIPNPLRDKSYTIINLDTRASGLGGSHWVARYTEGDNRAYYDSYARAISTILPYAHTRARDTDLTPNVNDQEKRGVNSKSCGQRSMATLLIARDFGMEAFMQM